MLPLILDDKLWFCIEIGKRIAVPIGRGGLLVKGFRVGKWSGIREESTVLLGRYGLVLVKEELSLGGFPQNLLLIWHIAEGVKTERNRGLQRAVSV